MFVLSPAAPFTWASHVARQIAAKWPGFFFGSLFSMTKSSIVLVLDEGNPSVAGGSPHTLLDQQPEKRVISWRNHETYRSPESNIKRPWNHVVKSRKSQSRDFFYSELHNISEIWQTAAEALVRQFTSNLTSRNLTWRFIRFRSPGGPFYKRGYILNPAWIHSAMPRKMWDEITYPFPHFNGCTFEVWQWRGNFTPHF